MGHFVLARQLRRRDDLDARAAAWSGALPISGRSGQGAVGGPVPDTYGEGAPGALTAWPGTSKGSDTMRGRGMTGTEQRSARAGGANQAGLLELFRSVVLNSGSGSDGLPFWTTLRDKLALSPLSKADQISFMTIVMQNSRVPRSRAWATPQIAYGAVITGYNGSNWDYILHDNPYIPWWDASGNRQSAADQCAYPPYANQGAPYNPSFWPPARLPPKRCWPIVTPLPGSSGSASCWT